MNFHIGNLKVNIPILDSRVVVDRTRLHKEWRYDAYDACAWGVITDGKDLEIRIPNTGYSYSRVWTSEQVASFRREAEFFFSECDVEKYEKKYSSTYIEYHLPDGKWYTMYQIRRNVRKGRLMGGMLTC